MDDLVIAVVKDLLTKTGVKAEVGAHGRGRAEGVRADNRLVATGATPCCASPAQEGMPSPAAALGAGACQPARAGAL